MDIDVDTPPIKLDGTRAFNYKETRRAYLFSFGVGQRLAHDLWFAPSRLPTIPVSNAFILVSSFININVASTVLIEFNDFDKSSI